MWNEDVAIEIARTMRELHQNVHVRIASKQWGEAFLDVARDMAKEKDYEEGRA